MVVISDSAQPAPLHATSTPSFEHFHQLQISSAELDGERQRLQEQFEAHVREQERLFASRKAEMERSVEADLAHARAARAADLARAHTDELRQRRATGDAAAIRVAETEAEAAERVALDLSASSQAAAAAAASDHAAHLATIVRGGGDGVPVSAVVAAVITAEV